MENQVPPHSMDAEIGALGAAMVHRQALGPVIENLDASDFWRPSHQFIFEVLAKAFAEGWQPDAFLVMQELERRGVTNVEWGELLDMTATAPMASSVMRYVKIVRETSILRRLAYAAGEIRELAFSDPADAFAALDAAKLRLGDVVDPTDTTSAVWVPDIAEIIRGGLEAEEPALLARVDGHHLLYRERMHTIQGLPSSGKSWIALHACVEILRFGGSALYLDYEDSPRGIIGRMLALGAEPAHLEARFVYVRPEAGFGLQTQSTVRRICEEHDPELAVIDGVAEAMAQDQLDENSNADFLAWAERCPRWLVRQFGTSVLMLDHTGKSKEAREEGRHSRGAGAKLAVVDGVVYTAKAVRPFSREKSGSTKLTVAKDRPGGVGAVGDVVGVLVVDPKARGEHVSTRIEPNLDAIKATDTWKPTVLMTKASEELERAGQPLSRRALEQLVHSDKPKLVQEAIARLIQEGFAQEKKQGRSYVISLVKPYGGEGDSPPAKDEQTSLDVDDDGTVVKGPWEGKQDDPLLDF